MITADKRWVADGGSESHWDQPNPYSDPEKCGLEIVEVHSDDTLSYEFDMIVLWRELATGKLYFASDSGCSCPSPFENYHALSDLTPLEGHTAEYADLVMDVKKGRDRYE